MAGEKASTTGANVPKFVAFLYRNAHYVVILIILIAWAIVGFGHLAFPTQPDRPQELAELILLSGGLGSLALLAYQIRFQRIQQRNDFHFNRIEAFYNHFLPKPQVTQATEKMANDLGLQSLWEGSGTALSPLQLNDVESRAAQTTKIYLDEFESLAAACASGFVDEQFAYCLSGIRVIRAYTIFEPFIRKAQQRNPKAYVEFADLANRWKEKRAQELKRPGTVSQSIYHHE